jgi:hypothetical protein
MLEEIMDHHLYSQIWPQLEGDDFEALKVDIAENGLHKDVVVYRDKILDGRSRERACKAANITIRYRDAGVNSDQAALQLIVVLNNYRRRQPYNQRAFAAARLANIIDESHDSDGARKLMATILDSHSIPHPTCGSIILPGTAEIFGVKYGAAQAARAILNRCGEAGANEVISGQIALWAKADAVRKPALWESKPSKRIRKAKPANGAAITTSASAVIFPTNPTPVEPVPAPKTIPVAAFKSPFLTPEQVDPEFKGTPMEFTAKYGHVPIMTAERYAATRFSDWAQFMRSLARLDRDMPELKDVDLNWLRNPSQGDVAKLAEALEQLRPRIAKAEAMLETAKAALDRKKINRTG